MRSYSVVDDPAADVGVVNAELCKLDVVRVDVTVVVVVIAVVLVVLHITLVTVVLH